MAAASFLRQDWDSRWRPVRNLVAVAFTILVLAAAPYVLLVQALAGTPLSEWGATLGNNSGLVLVAGLWTFLVLTVFGGQLRAAFRDYRRHF